MKAHQLAEILGKLENKPVYLFWDSSPRGIVEGVVNDDKEVVIVGEWGARPFYEKEKVVYAREAGKPYEEFDLNELRQDKDEGVEQ